MNVFQYLFAGYVMAMILSACSPTTKDAYSSLRVFDPSRDASKKQYFNSSITEYYPAVYVKNALGVTKVILFAAKSNPNTYSQSGTGAPLQFDVSIKEPGWHPSGTPLGLSKRRNGRKYHLTGVYQLSRPFTSEANREPYTRMAKEVARGTYCFRGDIRTNYNRKEVVSYGSRPRLESLKPVELIVPDGPFKPAWVFRFTCSNWRKIN